MCSDGKSGCRILLLVHPVACNPNGHCISILPWQSVKPAGKALTSLVTRGRHKRARRLVEASERGFRPGGPAIHVSLPRGSFVLKAVARCGPRADGRPCLSLEQSNLSAVWRCKSASSAGPRNGSSGQTKVPCLPVQPVSTPSTWKTRWKGRSGWHVAVSSRPDCLAH